VLRDDGSRGADKAGADKYGERCFEVVHKFDLPWGAGMASAAESICQYRRDYGELVAAGRPWDWSG
jgi:hypothetical protein